MPKNTIDNRPGPLRARLFLPLVFVFAATPATALVGSLEAIAAPMGSVFLRWEDISTIEAGFRIERKLDDGEFLEVVLAPAGAVNYTDTGLLPGRYTYRVGAVVPDREIPASEVVVESLPDWNTVSIPNPVFQGIHSGEAVFTFNGAGQLYTLQETTDFSAWESVAEPMTVAPFEEGEIRHPVTEGNTAYRILSEGYERPLEIGLNQPFEIPPEPDGVIYDVTDFGASPIIETNDDAVGINVAISIAEPGDVIYIPEGTYIIRQELELPSGVTLRGAGKDKTVLITEEIARAVVVPPEAYDIRIENFAISYLGDTEELFHGVYVGSSRRGDNSYRILIDGLRIERFSVHGVSLRDSHHVLVQNCEILNATNLGGGGHGYGVALNYPTNNNNWIRNNVIGPGIRHAVLIQYFAHNNLVEYNSAPGNSEDCYDLHGEDEYLNELRFNVAENGARDGFGVGNTGSTHDRSGPNNWIHHNTVINCLAGVEVIQGSDVVFIDDNTFQENDYGIRVHNLGGNQLYFRGNTIDSNTVGISVSNAKDVFILNNSIINQAAYGIEILSNVENVVDEGNTFSGNAQDYRP